MGKLTVSYNNNSIIDTTNDGSFTLATEGKLMADDVSVTFEGGVPLTLEVNVDTGSAVTVTNGTTTLTGTSENGKCTFTLPEAGAWTASAVRNGESSTTKTYNIESPYIVNLVFVKSTFNDNDWSDIRVVSDLGVGSDYWSIGDRKAVVLNGTVGSYTFSNLTTYAFIIGFNHNSDYEGGNSIHFQFGKTARSGGKDICFAAFHMNNSSTSSGGWESSDMRNTICGTSLSSYSGTFIAALPSDLRSVLKTVTKYTDNTGGGSPQASAVTATTDVIFLLAEWEVFGKSGYANSAEKDYQAQYAYYAAGNSKVKYKHSKTSEALSWWLRSPSSNYFGCVSSGGNTDSSDPTYSYGFAPAFCV